MERRIEVFTKANFPDAIGNEVASEIANIGITSVDEIRTVHVYLIDGDLSKDEIKRICSELLVDGLTQDYVCINGSSEQPADIQAGHKDNTVYTIEVTRKRGVMDPVESTVIKGIRDLGMSARSVKTAKRFLVAGSLSIEQVEAIADKVLANKIIEDVFINKDNLFYEDKNEAVEYVFHKHTLEILNADDEQLLSISQEGQLYLNLEEMKAVQKYFTTLGRNPTDVELETIAQTWSEHCMHKHSGE